jgi:hypothetical protein
MVVVLNKREYIAKTIPYLTLSPTLLTMPLLYRRLRGTVNHSENRRCLGVSVIEWDICHALRCCDSIVT